MDISNASLASLRRSLNTAWARGLEWKSPLDISFLFADFPSDGADNEYPWMNFTAQFREWLGDRQFNSLSAELFRVANRDFEKSEKCKATLIKDDRFGVFVNMIPMHGQAWQQLLYDIVPAVITANTTCFTGKAFLADDHPYGAYTLDNLTTDALSESSFEAAFTASSSWQFANGVYVRPRWTHLLHGPKMRSVAYHIVDAERHASGATQVDNPNFKRCQRVEIPDFVGAYDDYWALVDSSGVVKPIARQIRETPVPRTNDLEDIEESGEFKWMSSGRAAAAPTFPHLIYGGRL